MLRKYFQRSLLFHVIIYLSPKCLKSIEKVKKTDFFKKQGFRQSWTNVLGIVLQYSYFSVISRFPLQKLQRFRNFLAVLPPPTLYKVKTRKKILDTRVQHCLWSEGRGWTCMNWKTPQRCKYPKTFVHDCRPYYGICAVFVVSAPQKSSPARR